MAFIPIAFVLGLSYLLLIPAFEAPDEVSHFKNAYAQSNVLMGKSVQHISEKNLDYYRAKDQERFLKSDAIEKAMYVYEHIGDELAPESKTEIMKYINSPFYLHFPAAVGITTARICGMSNVAVFYMGRLFNLIFFTLCVYYGLKKIPIGKMILFTIALFPMTIHLAASYSYDAVINGIAFLFVSYCTYLIYEAQKVQKKDVIILLVFGALMVACKTGTYAPLCLLIFGIPKEKIGDLKKRILIQGGVVGGYVLFYSIVSLTTMMSVVSNTDRQIGWAGKPGYTVKMFIENPFKLCFIIMNTLWVYMGEWYTQVIGKKLGSLNIDILLPVVIGFFTVLLISSVKTCQEKYTLRNLHKIIIFVISIMSAGIVIMGLLIGWTPISALTVEGVQGRYFIPLLLGLVLLIKNKNVTLHKEVNNQLIFSILLLHIITFGSVLESVFIYG